MRIASCQHDDGIIIDIEQISDRRVRLGAGTLYAAIERLTREGLIEVDREEIVDSRLRRYYRLTGAGSARRTEGAGRSPTADRILHQVDVINVSSRPDRSA